MVVGNRLGDSFWAGGGAARRVSHAGVVACLLGLLGSDGLRGQCSMCKAAVTHSVEGQALAQGLNSGILFLLCVPFLLFGSISLLVWHSMKTRGRMAEE